LLEDTSKTQNRYTQKLKGRKKNEDFLIREMTISDYNSVYELWLRTSGIGLNNVDDSEKNLKKS
jgi:hypothetical protein